MTMVLHTHNRKLDFHPHMHIVVPGGGVDESRRQWKKKKSKYLFNQKALAKVFRARFLAALNEAGFSIPTNVPEKWIADCTHVGKGITALKYLSRYLYRGVISEKNIVSNNNGQVTFKYIESKTDETRYRTLKGEDFLHIILQHVLPKGFRRVRDYGFLHSNAKKCCLWCNWFYRLLLKVLNNAPGLFLNVPFVRLQWLLLDFVELYGNQGSAFLMDKAWSTLKQEKKLS